MKKTKVGIVGYGTIGKRVAEAVRLQDDMELVGVVFRRLNTNALTAQIQGIPIYLSDINLNDDFLQVDIEPLGDIKDLLENVSIIVDCTPRGQAEKNLLLYREYNVSVILQGGESERLGVTYNSFINTTDVKNETLIRVASCNTTGIVRILHALLQVFDIKHVFVTLVRCGTDPDKSSKGIVNGLSITTDKSHHANDVNLLLPDIEIYTKAVAAPMTHGHLLIFSIDIDREYHSEGVKKRFAEHPRIQLLPQKYSQSTSSIEQSYSHRKRGDRPFVIILEDSIEVVGQKLYFMASIHMESIVVPETIDSIRAKFSNLMAEEIIYKTDKALGINKGMESYQVK
ncbi:type II glyceraldehyde-3-phosphate dehydrogenase [Paenibacillus sp. FSL R5-0766]|uniref:type II glyceraldehyde-3-phosphate dehydrogenase n=1 Tax=unclassified Paenibacillus TaxID=185978 RepID=UPI00096D16F1|nr:type II glyceraldehyde-3-phosphate dehydrogenase [Paenibacillus sp. FSL R5-0765]OMF61056.1 hypothetical protein BK141_22185 [Paenibacillus sp. FSL R5-0765]